MMMYAGEFGYLRFCALVAGVLILARPWDRGPRRPSKLDRVLADPPCMAATVPVRATEGRPPWDLEDLLRTDMLLPYEAPGDVEDAWAGDLPPELAEWQAARDADVAEFIGRLWEDRWTTMIAHMKKHPQD